FLTSTSAPPAVIYPLSLHDALPICPCHGHPQGAPHLSARTSAAARAAGGGAERPHAGTAGGDEESRGRAGAVDFAARQPFDDLNDTTRRLRRARATSWTARAT